MKKNIGNYNELLKNLLHQGDPSAFFSLAMPYFRERYQIERANGQTSPDATNTVCTEAVSLLEQLQDIPAKRFDTWFEEHCSISPSPHNETVVAVLPDNRATLETDRFLNECLQQLIRKESQLKKKRQAKKGSERESILRNRLFIPIGIFLFVPVICVGALFIMSIFHLSCSITFSASEHYYVINIPPKWMNFRIGSRTIVIPSVTDTIPQVFDTATLPAPDTATQKADTIPSTIKKSESPNVSTRIKKSTVSAPITENRQPPPAIKKPQPEIQYTPPPPPPPTYPEPATIPTENLSQVPTPVETEPPSTPFTTEETIIQAPLPSGEVVSESGNNGL